MTSPPPTHTLPCVPSFYPVFPAEVLGGFLPLDASSTVTAQASSVQYTDFVNGGRPLDVFNAAIIPLAQSGAAPLPPAAFTSEEIVAGVHSRGLPVLWLAVCLVCVWAQGREHGQGLMCQTRVHLSVLLLQHSDALCLLSRTFVRFHRCPHC